MIEQILLFTLLMMPLLGMAEGDNEGDDETALSDADLEAETNKALGITNGEPADSGSQEEADTENGGEQAAAEADSGSEEQQASEKDTQGDEPTEDLVEYNGEKYFYHPDVHAEGEEALPNSYKSREDAEYAAINKVDKIGDLVSKLRENNQGITTLGLPQELQENLENLENLQDLEKFAGMNADELRSFLKQGDQFIKRADQKVQKIEQQNQEQQKTEELSQELQKAQSKAEEALDAFQVDASQFKSDNELLQALDSQLETVVSREIKDAEQDLEKFRNDEDKAHELGVTEFGRQLQEKVQEVEQKKGEARRTYQQHRDSVADFLKKANEHQQQKAETQPSDEEIQKNRISAFQTFQEDMQGRHRMFQTADQGEASYFYKWAVRNAHNYNNLQHPDDFMMAIPDFEKHIESLRGNVEKQTQQKTQQKQGGPEVQPSQNQNQFTSKPKHAQEEISSDLDELTKESNAYLQN